MTFVCLVLIVEFKNLKFKVEEDDDMLMALVRSQIEHEKEADQACRLELQEEALMRRAIAKSQKSFQEEREMRELMRITEQLNDNEVRVFFTLFIFTRRQHNIDIYSTVAIVLRCPTLLVKPSWGLGCCACCWQCASHVF